MVTSTNLWTQAWNQFYNLIKNNAVDPTGKPTWITSAFPDDIKDTKDEYPFVVINPIESDLSSTITLPRGSKSYTLRLLVELYSTSNEQLDSITDDVFDAIDSNEDTLYAQNIANLELRRTDTDTLFRGDIRVHRRTIEWTFEYYKAS